MIALGVIVAVVLAATGLAASWYRGTRTAAVAGIALACATVASAFVLNLGTGQRSGIFVALDDSCDSPLVTPTISAAVRSVLGKGIDGDAAVVLGWFADNARSSRRVILDLTDVPPASVQRDEVAFANWKAPRALEAEQAMTMLETSPCRRIGTSIIGAAEAANDALERAGVTGRRQIVLVTNLIEFSDALKIPARKFGLADVPAAVRAISDLPPELRQPLASQTDVKILFVPLVRHNGRERTLKETTAVALQSWARRVFGHVLHADTVQIEVLPTDT